MYWPSFNCALATGGSQQRTVINTILALCASCTATFCWSGIFRKGKFDIVEIQNATLAGGVAVGCTADLIIHPFGALILGFVAGAISTFGFFKIMPFLESTIGLHDTAGIHNLHGMPGVLGGLGGIFTALTSDRNYGDAVSLAYTFRANTTTPIPGIPTGTDRSEQIQAGFQAAALFTSIGIALVGGIITSLILKLPCFCRIKDEEFFLDKPNWNALPEDYPTRKLGQQDDNFDDKINGIKLQNIKNEEENEDHD